MPKRRPIPFTPLDANTPAERTCPREPVCSNSDTCAILEEWRRMPLRTPMELRQFRLAEYTAFWTCHQTRLAGGEYIPSYRGVVDVPRADELVPFGDDVLPVPTPKKPKTKRVKKTKKETPLPDVTELREKLASVRTYAIRKDGTHVQVGGPTDNETSPLA